MSLTSPKPTADISNMKIEDTDIFYGRLNETSVPPECICTSSESSQEDTVSGNEDMLVPYYGKYFHSFDILPTFQMLSFLINSLSLF